MKKLNNNELMKIDGGSSTVLIVSVIAELLLLLLVFYLDILIHKNVIDGGCYMKKLENDELLKVDGGTDVISATMINSIYKIVSFIYDLVRH